MVYVLKRNSLRTSRVVEVYKCEKCSKTYLGLISGLACCKQSPLTKEE